MAEAVGFSERLDLGPEVGEITETLERAGYETWAVGGALRDRLLGDAQSDVDLATSAPPEEVQRLFKHTVPVGLLYGTVGVLDRWRHLHEVTTFRRDVETDGRHAVVRFGVSLEEDLARRDFTINAIAYHPLRHQWADPHQGREDLRRRIVRAVGDPADRFKEDYLRVLRALRFAARFDFAIEERTWLAAREAAPGLGRLSAERVRDEWFKGLMTARSVARLCRLWRDAKAAQIWLSGLRDPYPGADPSPEPRDPVVLTVLLCHAAGAVMERLRASNSEIARAVVMERGPQQPEGAEDVAVRRWLRAVGGAADDLMLLAQYRLGDEPEWVGAVRAVRSRGDPMTRRDLAIDGRDLLAAGVPAGPEVGALLDRLLDTVISDPGLNSRERLLDLVREWR